MASGTKYFSVTIFFVVFREALEAVIVVSVLLAFLKQSMGDFKDLDGTESVSEVEEMERKRQVYKKLRKQVWVGAFGGIGICLVLGGTFIGVFYSLGSDLWSKSEDLWEGIFCVIATLLISFMGIAMLRIQKMQEKWRVKLAEAIVQNKENKHKHKRFSLGKFTTKYSMLILPLITTLREGMEAVVFVGGVGMGTPATAFPIPVIIGLVCGALIGYGMYFWGSRSSLQIFLVISTSILYLISAGLLSRGVWFFENYIFSQKTGGDAAESGSGPGSYNIKTTVWHVNCCNPLTDNGWDVFNSILGWQNTATYGSVISYNLYWLVMILFLMLMLYEEKRGHLPGTSKRMSDLKPSNMFKKKEKSEAEKRDIVERAKKINLMDEN